MEQKITVGLKFTSKNFDMTAEVHAVRPEQNQLDVLLTPKNGSSWIDDNWNLQHTIWGFENGEYTATPPTDTEQSGEELFTGGDWKVDEKQPAIVRLNSFIRVDQVLELENCPSAANYESFTESGEAEANAALIAESKNLYNELKEILLWMKVKDGRAEWKGSEQKANELKALINRINNKK